MSVYEIAKFIHGSILPTNENDLDGIFHHKKSLPVNITASSIYHGDELDDYRYPHAVIEYWNKTWWTSENNQNPQWILFNFTKRRLIITNYSVQSLDNPKNAAHAKQWVVEGYNDNKEWVIIDKFIESKGNSPLYIETRGVYNNERPFSAIKISKTGINWQNTGSFRFYKVDFFGIIENCSNIVKTCKARNNYFHIHTIGNNQQLVF